MSRISPVDPAIANAKAKPLLDAVGAKLGVTPNMMRTMARSPAVLEGYLNLSGALSKASRRDRVRGGSLTHLNLSGALSKASLGASLGELIALDVAEANRCGYCLSAHTYLATNVAKLSGEQIQEARDANSHDPKIRAALQFARQINEQRGEVTDAQVQAARAAGYDDAAIAEIVAYVALNVVTNYFNIATQVEIDFPVVLPATATAAA